MVYDTLCVCLMPYDLVLCPGRRYLDISETQNILAL